MPGEAIVFAACCSCVFHLIAIIFGFTFRRVTKSSCAVVFCISFFPGLIGLIQNISIDLRLRYFAPRERFKENLASQIPDSVKNLRFVHKEYLNALVFEFDIDPQAFDVIIERNKFARVDHTKIVNINQYYIPKGEEFEMYQATGPQGKKTLITNVSHNHVIFHLQ